MEPAAAEAPAPAAAAAARPALPPANNFGAFTSEPPPADPTGTNVFADPKCVRLDVFHVVCLALLAGCPTSNSSSGFGTITQAPTCVCRPQVSLICCCLTAIQRDTTAQIQTASIRCQRVCRPQVIVNCCVICGLGAACWPLLSHRLFRFVQYCSDLDVACCVLGCVYG
jgi:hypothetical protein